MRNLASIQKISNLSPIEGADALEVASVLGWKVVVKRGDFKEGDLVVYCEVDSILPDKPEFEFLRPRGMRIRTIKLRGQVSQGICFPLSVLPEGVDTKEGLDCTEALGVVKYEPPIPACLSGVMKGNFPSFIPKTDETRVQVLQRVLDKYKSRECYITEKLDGSSVTFYLKDGEFGVCSRNIDLARSEENSFWKAAINLNVEEKLRRFTREYGDFLSNIALQGELVGEGIQGNKLGLRGQTVYFFNIFDIDEFEYAEYDEVKSILDYLDLSMVPVLSEDYLLENDIDAIIERSKIRSTINPDVWAEGIVIRPLREKIDLLLSNEKFNNGRVSFKAINPNFLLKYGE